MKITPLKAAALAGALGAAIAGASFAQPAPARGPDARPHAMGERPDPAAMAERRAQHLRDVLQLTPRQEPALQTFLAAMKPPEGARGQMRQHRQEMAGLTTPQRLDRMKARMAERQARFDQRAAAVKRFYAELTPTQQKAFDALGPMGGRRGGMHGIRGMHGAGMGGMTGMGGMGGDHDHGAHGMGPGDRR